MRIVVTGFSIVASFLPAAVLAESNMVVVDEVIVTGEKKDQSLQETITSVGLINGAQLERDAIDSLANSLSYIANVNLGDSEGGFSIRGIPFDTLLGAGSSPLAQIYIDDVTIGDKATRFGVDSIWDVSQIEILRGAQSTVQGRNALAGAIIIRTQDPTYEWTGKARAIWLSSDNGDEYSVSYALGGPIVDDVLAFRIAGERRESDGFVSNVVLGEEGADFNDQWQGRVKLLFEPSHNISSLFTFNYNETLVADRVSDRRSRDANGFVNFSDVVPGNEFLRQSFVDEPDFNSNKSYHYSLKTNWDVSDAISLTVISAYSVSNNDEKIDTDGTNRDSSLFPEGEIIIANPFNIPTIPDRLPRFRAAGTQREDQTVFTQELRASYDRGGRLRGLIGGYYADSREDEFNFPPSVQTGIQNVVDGATRPIVQTTLIEQLAPLRGVAALGNPVAAIPADAAGDAPFDAFIDSAVNSTVGAILGNYSDLGAFVALSSEPLDVRNFAFYIQGEYDVTNRLMVGFGLRYDNERQDSALTLSGAPIGLPDPATPFLPDDFEPAFVPLVQGALINLNGFFEATLAETSTSTTQKSDALLPSGFVRFSIDDARSLGFSVRRGYRSGGVDLNIPRQFVSKFGSEFTLNYELAFRSLWFDSALRFNANAFYTDWTDQQVVVALSTIQFDTVGFNVGSSTVKGFETDISWAATPHLTLQGSLGYTDAEFKDFDVALAEVLIEAQSQLVPVDLEQTLAAFENQEFSFAPSWSGAARIAYTGDSGLFGVLGATYEGESFVNNANSGGETFLNNDRRLLVNFTAGYEFDYFTIAFVARNLFDKDYVASGGNELVRLGTPRELGVRVQAAF